MTWFENISVLTLASWGIGWFAVSGMLALALGRIIGRNKDVAAPGEMERVAVGVVAASSTAVQETAPGLDPWGAAAEPDFDPWDAVTEPDAEYTGRAASGTRFKPVEGEDREALMRPGLRRVR